MTAKVIQGFFLGGQPKLAAVQPRIAAPPPIQAKTAAPAPATAFAGRPPGPPIPAFGARPSGPPAPAFAPRPGAVQRHGAGNAFAIDSGAVGLAAGGGKPLPDAVRGQMEAALGADFSNVRVHVGPQAERIGAIAFTVGSDIYFAPGRYQPDTVQGQQLLGHELTHVVQQRAGRVRNPLGSGLAVVQDHALEAEADRLGQRAAMHRVAAQAKMPPAAAQPSAPVRVSAPISDGHGSYRLTAGAAGRQVGSVMVHARDKGAVEITDLQVAEAQRGHGIGHMLLASAARTGQQFGRSKVTLAAQDNGSGHLTQWYKGMGFAQTGVNQRGYPQLEAPISRVLAGTAQRREMQRAGAGPGQISRTMSGVAQEGMHPPDAPPLQIAQTSSRRALQLSSDPNYTTELLESATEAGARLGKTNTEWVDIDTVPRKKIAWFGKSIQIEMGLDDKPLADSTCKKCGKKAKEFHLDHMTPWRHYAAALVGENYIWQNSGKTYIRKDALKALYNDPENLWWICGTCNLSKSDIIPETVAHSQGDFSQGTYGRNSEKPSSFVGK